MNQLWSVNIYYPLIVYMLVSCLGALCVEEVRLCVGVCVSERVGIMCVCSYVHVCVCACACSYVCWHYLAYV